MRMRKTVIAGLACGVVCAMAVVCYTQSVQADARKDRDAALAEYGGSQVEVCVASRDLFEGEVLSEDMITTRSWLVDLLPEDALSSVDDAIGKRLASPVLEGEPISSKRFDEGTGSLAVPEGMVALSLPTTPSNSAGGRLDAGSVVDVYATGDAATTLLVSGAMVLEAGAQSSSASGPSWVTVAVAPERVQELVDASQRMELSFALPSAGEERGE